MQRLIELHDGHTYLSVEIKILPVYYMITLVSYTLILQWKIKKSPLKGMQMFFFSECKCVHLCNTLFTVNSMNNIRKKNLTLICSLIYSEIYNRCILFNSIYYFVRMQQRVSHWKNRRGNEFLITVFTTKLLGCLSNFFWRYKIAVSFRLRLTFINFSLLMSR